MNNFDVVGQGKQSVSMKSPDTVYGEIRKMMADDSPKETIGALEMFLAIWPDYALAHNDLGVMYFKEGEKEKALGHYERAAGLQPANITFQKNLADFYYVELGRVEEAMQIYLRVLNADPEDVETLLIIGNICVALEQHGDAADFYNRVLETDPGNNDAIRNLDKLFCTEASAVEVPLKQGYQRSDINDVATTNDSEEYLVSAIVSTYNSERFIRGCLEDLEAQTIADKLEIIVVNSGSEQDEELIVNEFQQKHSNIKYIKTDERETVYAAWNRGVKTATGKYITNSNSDDRHRKDAFEVMVRILEALPEVALVYADLIITEVANESFDQCTPAGYFRWLNWNRKDLLEKGCFMGPQPMWRKSVHDEYGYFDGSFVTSGDYEFWLRISQTSTFLHIPVLLGLYLRSPGSIEHANRKRQAEENKTILEMYKSAYEPNKIIKRHNTDSISHNPDKGKKLYALTKPDKIIATAPDADFQNNLTSIIILVSSPQKHIQKCVESIKSHTPEQYEIIFVDNGYKGGTLKWIRETFKRKSNHKVIKAEKKAGLAECINRGMKAASGEYIIFLHDHMMVADGWLDGMLNCINSANNIGVVGPMTNKKAAGIQCIPNTEHVGIGQFEKFAGAFREKNRHRHVPSREITDFCMLFRRSLVQRIGLFDEELEQGSESDDYCLRAALEGYHNFIAGDVFILCGDIPPQGNKRSFRHKWHGIDAKSHNGERLAVLNTVEAAENLYHREEVDKAVVALIDGLKYRPNEKAIYHRLAEMLIDCGRFEEGLEALNSIPEGKGDDAKALALAGYCKEGMELYDEAAQFADRALSLNVSSAPALNLKGMLAYKWGDMAASEGFFNRAIASDPGYGDPHTNMGILTWEAGRKEDALKLLEKGCILSSTNADNVTAYLSVISEMSGFERAEDIFREAKALYPQNRRIAFLLIDTLIRQEKYESAIHEIREAMITFGINDGILSAAQAVLNKLNTQETKYIDKKPSLSLCMIVKDEEDYLARCLMSAIPVADEIVIVDTGSTDRTKEIAQVFGAKVYDFEWTDDFSEARNLSLSKAKGDWLLILDADEVISPLDYDRLTKIVKDDADRPAAYSVTTRNYVSSPYVPGWTCNDGKYAEEEGGTGWYPSRKVRLFTNDSRIRFDNPIHEFVDASLKKYGIRIKKCGIPVHHYARLNLPHDIAKGEGYYLLSKKNLEGKDDDLQSLIEFAVQAGSEFEKYEEAVNLWKRVLKMDAENIKAFLNMSYNHLQLGQYEEARKSSKKAMSLDPDLKDAVIVYATCELTIGDAGKAVPILEDLLEKTPGYPMAVAILSAAYGMGDKREKGLEHIKYLMKTGFACGDYLHDLAERLISTGKTEKAVALLEFAVECGTGTKEIRELLENLRFG
ncbi:MAG: hypothetical protein B6I30_07850 [Desulfobacteraceae bacterium 4572_187]|nr:MAG: hypothetical protein B6I30_07850 [Desulfobacteraceae bacterium 4572_187]